ncbi:MAG: ferrochelatase [Campylobacterales bacterium]|nr:ferrochelatase [Campylobacterales bacterium]
MSKGLVLLNMGGPNNLDEVKVFLHNMFNDPNIITVKSDLLRRFIAFIITTSRTRQAKENYAALGGKSPLVDYTKGLVAKLQEALPDTYVTYAMRYTPPFAASAIDELKTHGVTQLCLLPLYPHYSTTTTKSSLEDFEEALKKANFAPACTSISRFFDHPTYNQSMVKRVEEALGGEDSREYVLIFSAHSLPQKIIDAGDPYQQEVLAHAVLLKEQLREAGLVFQATHTAYQSKLGPVKWLTPELGETLKTLKGKKVLIVPIAFTIDNSETEFELWIEYKEEAEKQGIHTYKVAKCPNDHDLFVQALREITQTSTQASRIL